MSLDTLPSNQTPGSAITDQSDVAVVVRRRSIRSRIYLPALSIVAVAIVLVLIGLSSRWGGAGFTASMTDQRVVVVGPVTIGILLLFMVVERLRPAQRRTF